MTVKPRVMEARVRGVAVVLVLPGLMEPVEGEVVLHLSAGKQEHVLQVAVPVNPVVYPMPLAEDRRPLHVPLI